MNGYHDDEDYEPNWRDAFRLGIAILGMIAIICLVALL